MQFICLGLALSAIPACDRSENFYGTVMPEDMPVINFTLTDQHGGTYNSSEHRGKVILLFFGYTFCPDVCPATLSTWKRVQQMLHDQAGEVEFVYITVDPERDTRATLERHLALFSPTFFGLTGDTRTLENVWAAFGVYREVEPIPDSQGAYLVNHSTRIIVLDKTGKWRLAISYIAPPEEIVHDIRLLLKS